MSLDMCVAGTWKQRAIDKWAHTYPARDRLETYVKFIFMTRVKINNCSLYTSRNSYKTD
jgi:hypothetical protein